MDLLELSNTASLLPKLLYYFTHLSTLKYQNSAILLMPKLNIFRVKFLQMEIDS